MTPALLISRSRRGYRARVLLAAAHGLQRGEVERRGVDSGPGDLGGEPVMGGLDSSGVAPGENDRGAGADHEPCGLESDAGRRR
jgi:hypothetical protein